MSGWDWIAEERQAVRRADEFRRHVQGCTCRQCAEDNA